MGDMEKIRRICADLNSLERKNIDKIKNEILSLDKTINYSVLMMLEEAAFNDAAKKISYPRIELVKLALISCYLDIESVAKIISETELSEAGKLAHRAFLIALKHYSEDNPLPSSILNALGNYLVDRDSFSYQSHYVIKETIKHTVAKGVELPPAFFLSISHALVDNFVFLSNGAKESEKEKTIAHTISLLNIILLPLKNGYLLPARSKNDPPPFLESVKLMYRLGVSLGNQQIKDLAVQVIAFAGKNGQNVLSLFCYLPRSIATTQSSETRKVCLECIENLISNATSLELIKKMIEKIELAREQRLETTKKLLSNASKLGLRIRIKDPVLLKLESLVELLKQRMEFAKKDILLNDKVKSPSSGGSLPLSSSNKTKLGVM
ncbi:MAG: hypothetical protein QW255_03125 [Candidatus Bilamarchaeaceae archaeon]